MSDRDYRFNNRNLLAGATESTTQTETEIKALRKYKTTLDILHKCYSRLDVVEAEIKENDFPKRYDKDKMEALIKEKKELVAKIDELNETLLKLEASKSLGRILQIEKEHLQQKIYGNIRSMTEPIEEPKVEPKIEPKEKNANWGWKILAALIFLPFVILALLPIIRALERIWELSKDNVGLFFFNLVAFPLGIVGGVKVFMGVFELAGNYAEEHNITKDWQVGLYGLITILEVLALGYILLIS